MHNRIKYFQRVHDDIAELRLVFAHAYEEAHTLYANADRKRDARITVFAKFLNVSFSAEIGLSLFVTQLLDPKNFSKIIVVEMTDKEKRHYQDEFQQFLKMAMVNAFFSSLESSFQTFVKIADPKFSPKDKGFKQIYQHTLKELNLQQYTPLTELLRLTRNTMHTNGYHLEKDQTIIYNDKTYAFIKNKPANFLTWSFIAVFMYDIREMLLAIIKSKPFADTEHIDDPFIGFDWPDTLD